MEALSTRGARAFVVFMMGSDPQILANRREGKALLMLAIDEDGEVKLSADKFDKLVTFLSLNDQQVHGSGADNTVSIYSFVKILQELRRKLRGEATGTATPETGGGV